MVPSKILMLLAASLVSAQQTTPDLASLLESTESLSMLRDTLAEYPDLLTTLAGATDITVLAPSNEAFLAWMDMASYDMAKDNKEAIAALLSYHVLNGTYASSDVTSTSQFLPTLVGDYEEFRNLSGDPQVVGVMAMDGDVVFTSGLKTESTVTTADVEFEGGVAHIIDRVLAPPMSVSATAMAMNLSSLVGALQTAELVETVDMLAKVTIFAPNDAAFMAIGNILPDVDNEGLSDILTYHVVPGVVGYSSGLENGMELTTVQGEQLTVRILDGDVYVNGAKVVVADVLVNNGVVHVIDSVLNPDAADDEPDTAVETQDAAFPSATAVEEAPFSNTTSGTPSATMTDVMPQETNAAGKWGVSIAAVAAAAAAFGFA